MTTSRGLRRFGIGLGIVGLGLALAPAAQAAPARHLEVNRSEVVLVLQSWLERALGGNGVGPLLKLSQVAGQPELAAEAAGLKAHVDNPAQSPMTP